jgi:hypothetical protein
MITGITRAATLGLLEAVRRAGRTVGFGCLSRNEMQLSAGH